MIDTIRVSCATLCRIEHQNRYLLLLNASRRRRGIYVLSPIGGALSLYDTSRLEAFNATPEDPLSLDLRLTMPVASLPAFREWFYAGQGREQSPLREVQEELVYESGLLPALAPEDVVWRHLWSVEEESYTQRYGPEGILTHYFLEIYEVKFETARTLEPLIAASPESGALWVTAQQINERAILTLTIDGVQREAQVNAYLLLNPPSGEERD